MNIIDIADYQKSISVVSVENESLPVSWADTPAAWALTEEEVDHIEALLDYFRDMEDNHSAFKVLCSITSILSHELLGPSNDPLSDPFMVPLNDNHSL